MKCAVNDGREAVAINNIDRYCNEHYQIYDMLKRLYPGDFMPWQEYLSKVLDTNYNAPWKISLIDASNGSTLDIVASVARAELKWVHKIVFIGKSHPSLFTPIIQNRNRKKITEYKNKIWQSKRPYA